MVAAAGWRWRRSLAAGVGAGVRNPAAATPPVTARAMAEAAAESKRKATMGSFFKAAGKRGAKPAGAAA